MSELSKIVERLRKQYDVREPWRPKGRFGVEPVFAVYHPDLRTLLAAAEKVERLREALGKYADADNWGYYDESGCPKGHGRNTDACFIGPEVARAALTESEAEHGA